MSLDRQHENPVTSGQGGNPPAPGCGAFPVYGLPVTGIARPALQKAGARPARPGHGEEATDGGRGPATAAGRPAPPVRR
jgi:hypothetical protein